MSNIKSHTYPSMPRRRSYLLRVWSDDPEARWRASLQGVSDGEWRHFPDLESLFDYLKDSGAAVENEPQAEKNR